MSDTASLFAPPLSPDTTDLRQRTTARYAADEAEVVEELIRVAEVDEARNRAIHDTAVDLVKRVRARSVDQSPVESFMRQYDLSSEEGVLLMCVAEALLRIPDAETADKLISDKLADANWASHAGKSESLFVNAGTWGLMLTGKLVKLGEDSQRNFASTLKRLISRSGEPMVRVAVRQAMKIMGHQFVMGRTIEEALKRSESRESRAYRHSFDMLGEAALTRADAARYLVAYEQAIAAIGKVARGYADPVAAPSISVKLSALHPRYEKARQDQVLAELVPIVLKLARQAKAEGIAMTIDAEEADRLELSMDLIQRVYADASLDGWSGLGLALQAYQKRALPVIEELAAMVRRVGRRLNVRLVKGAYWDSEIKRAQIDGLSGYPVYTRKHNTDLSYLACARRLFAHGDLFYPQFATHNAHTIAAIHHLGHGRPYEFQRLHGMGDALYAEVVPAERLNAPCRVYAPVGSHEDLLPYLVRRLLENGANTSFVNRIVDASVPPEQLIEDPVAIARATMPKAHPRIPLPAHLYGAERRNSAGINLAHDSALKALAEGINAMAARPLTGGPLLAIDAAPGLEVAVTRPADRRQAVGTMRWTAAAAIDGAIAAAVKAQPEWDRTPVDIRAQALERLADRMEAELPALIALCTLEAGKTIPDGIAEVREAVDFCRYYAREARRSFEPKPLPGPTGESNTLYLHGRGVFVCISPWNFPLAIFIGQVAAALVAGNTVLAKPAEQTGLIAHRAVQLAHEAGIPRAVLQLLPGDGASVGAALCRDPRIAGVAFTGSTDTARLINKSLAEREGPIGVLIAETGGQNALLADSSALPEQLVKDALQSAFGSAGQRCSALRVLFVQEEIAERTMTLIAGAMQELTVGDPASLATDVGPVIDSAAREVLIAHIDRMQREARLIQRIPLPAGTEHGCYVAPHAFELKSLDQLSREVFGPVLHVIRYKARELDTVIDAINATGYGLTLGIHSRIDATIEHIASRIRAGNCYVNRNMIGAVVGVQPFGGEGLSGTGPKAGGPHYLHRFTTERTRTINTTAAGGNASLLTIAG
ncbi:MAG: bifunctional proline dehydrogenase/L-glutamate gamma-semialdehyde dehydrogenase PutA [Xanthomonadales bacterium]|jgi:RHH-type proline utilization regulon transcriptional repressor/proline dehydrogenase/delta 1-pyrroline-5-carboxylate dehydrogenase|nr:bifunctional proline dehydrogenase/L-glutamate gamma-semialdehyde dehydrogenase PutA [Xanthomonadales bacterium]